MTNYPPPPAYGPPPPYGAPSTGKQRLRGRIPLRLALIFGVIGLALAIAGGVVLAKESFGKVDGFERVSVASGGTVQFDRTGKYLAYYEADDVDSGISRVPVPAIRLTDPSGQQKVLDTLYGGRSVQSGDISTKLTYDYNKHRGVAIYQFTISNKGRYQVEVGPSSEAAPGSSIAFGESIASGTAIGVLLLLPGIALIITAIVLLIVGLVKRGRHKTQLSQYSYGAPPPTYPSQPGYGPPGGPYPSNG